MAAALSDCTLEGEAYLSSLLDSKGALRERAVEVIDEKTGGAIQAKIIAAYADSSTVRYEMRGPLNELYGFIKVWTRNDNSLYVVGLRSVARGKVKRVGACLLDQAFLLSEAHAAIGKGRAGMMVVSLQEDRDEPDPVTFYLKYGFLPVGNERPRYPEIPNITRTLKQLRREDPDFDLNSAVIRAKEILSIELDRDSVSTEELMEKWYWDGNTAPNDNLDKRILRTVRYGLSTGNTPMELPLSAIGAIRQRLLGSSDPSVALEVREQIRTASDQVDRQYDK